MLDQVDEVNDTVIDGLFEIWIIFPCVLVSTLILVDLNLSTDTRTPIATLARSSICFCSPFWEIVLSISGSNLTPPYHAPRVYGDRAAFMRRSRAGSSVRSIFGPIRASEPAQE
jgi:hypothetical protein